MTNPSGTRTGRTMTSARISYGNRLPAGAAALMLGVSAVAMMTGSARADCDSPSDTSETITCDADFGGGFGVNALGGDDTVNITGGVYSESITGGNGMDTITMTGGTVQMEIAGQGNSDVINLVSGTVDTVLGDGPDDGEHDEGGENDIQLNFHIPFVPEPPAADTITLSGATVVNDILGNEGDDVINLVSGSIGGDVFGNDDDDTITLNGVGMFGFLSGDAGNDIINVVSGFAGSVQGGTGEDTITVSGGSIQFTVTGGNENDTVNLLGGIVGSVQGDLGEDTITLNGTSVAFAILGGSGNDQIELLSGSASDVRGNDGEDSVTLNGASVSGEIKGDGDDDTITLLSGSVLHVEGNNGMDTILQENAAVTGDILGQGLSDSITLNGGSVSGDVFGDGPDFIDGVVDVPGADTISLNGTIIAGSILGNEGGDTINLFSGSVGSVEGNSGSDTVTLAGAAVVGDINGGSSGDVIALLSGTVGGNVLGESGTDIIALDGAMVVANIDSGTGTDLILLSSGSFGGNLIAGSSSDGVIIAPTYDLATILGNLDGTSGLIDTLEIQASGTLTGEQVLNWDVIDVNAATVTFEGGGLTTSTILGMSGIFGATIDFDDGFDLVGSLTISPTSTLQADTPGGTGMYSVSADLRNFGTIDLSDGFGAGDTLIVGDDYTASSELLLDVALDSTEAGDSLVILDDIAGVTELTLTDTNPFGVGSYTGTGPGAGILLVDNSAGGDIQEGDFIIDPIAHPENEIVKGPFVYGLSLEDDDILYLQSDVLAQVYGYAILAELMREDFPILRERLGDRRYNGFVGDGTDNGGAAGGGVGWDNGGIWARIDGKHREIEHAGNFDTGEWEASRAEAEVGVDIPMNVGGGVGVVGISAHFVQGYADANSGLTMSPDVAEIDTTGFGAGLSFAYFPGGGFYADVQGRLTAWDADVENAARDIEQDVNAIGWGTSMEVGNRMAFGNTAVTPRGQVVYSDVHISNFTDDDGIEVRQDKSTSLVIEGGVTIEQMFADNGVGIFTDLSVNHDVLSDSSVNASGTTFKSGLEDTWGTVALGATMETGDGTSAFIQGEVSSPIGSTFGNSMGYGLKAGVRVDF